jgi:hypothetical protein
MVSQLIIGVVIVFIDSNVSMTGILFFTIGSVIFYASC